MTQDEVYVWFVKERTARRRGRWAFGSLNNAQAWVEAQCNEQPVEWTRKSAKKWVVTNESGTWIVDAIEIRDAVGLFVEDPVAQKP